MARNLHPEQVKTERDLQRNFRSIEALLDGLIDSGGSLEAFLLGGRPAGQAGYGGTLSGDDLELHSNLSEDGLITAGVLVVDEATGRVGINVAVPLAVLHLQVSASGASVPGAGSDFVLERGGNAGMSILTPDASKATIIFGAASDNDYLRLRADYASGKSELNVVRGTGSPFNLSLGSFSPGFQSGLGLVFLANSDTSPSGVPAGGIFWEAKDVEAKSELFAHNEAGESARLTGNIAVTTADFTKTDATLTAIPGATRNVEAGKTYRFVARIYDQMSATGGYKLQLTGTATATYLIAHYNRHPVASGAFSLSNTVTSLGHTPVGEATPGSATGYIECRGTIVVNAGGTLRLDFAQNSASGSSTIKRGMTLEIMEI